ncbi:hypothetical protein CTEN210_13677 [Chaetoceros tenuissimus]|uniref:Uncharacterized protein n=1 Tax=Chaetoceros tenuissimus TaxID=426638 RepID=A0AAD3D5R9_9STRA|nr:hypothetical protein CTEN210_13677 [Chaetoceros tenuissimus]
MIMNHSFKNLPRAKEVNEQQQVAMHATETVSDDDDLTGQEFNTHRSQAVSNPFHSLYMQFLPGKISFGEFQQQIYVRAQQLLKGKERNKNIKDGHTEYSDDNREEEEATLEEFPSVEQSNCLNADSHVSPQKTAVDSKANTSSSLHKSTYTPIKLKEFDKDDTTPCEYQKLFDTLNSIEPWVPRCMSKYSGGVSTHKNRNTDKKMAIPSSARKANPIYWSFVNDSSKNTKTYTPIKLKEFDKDDTTPCEYQKLFDTLNSIEPWVPRCMSKYSGGVSTHKNRNTDKKMAIPSSARKANPIYWSFVNDSSKNTKTYTPIKLKEFDKDDTTPCEYQKLFDTLNSIEPWVPRCMSKYSGGVSTHKNRNTDKKMAIPSSARKANPIYWSFVNDSSKNTKTYTPIKLKEFDKDDTTPCEYQKLFDTLNSIEPWVPRCMSKYSGGVSTHKNRNTDKKMAIPSSARKANPIYWSFVDDSLSPVSNLVEEDPVRRPKSILLNNDAKFPIDKNAVINLDDDEDEVSVSSLTPTYEERPSRESICLNVEGHYHMHAASGEKFQQKDCTPITDEIDQYQNELFARNIAKSSNGGVRKDRITVAIKKSFRGSYRDRSDTYLRQFELDNRGTVFSTNLHEQGKLRLRAIARRHLYIPVDRSTTLIELGHHNSKGKWQGKNFRSSLSIVVEEEIELDASTSASSESLLSSTTPATGPSSITTESTKPEIDLINSSTASSIASALDSSFRPSDPFPSSQSLFKVTKNGKRRKLNPASDGIIDATYSWCTSSPAPSPPPPVKIEVIAMANDCQMQKEMSSNDSDNLVQKSLAPTSPASQTSEQESQLQQINVSPSSLSSHPSGSNDIDRRKRRKRYRQSEACTSQHSHTTSLVQESPMTNENVLPSSSSLVQSGLNDIARRKRRQRNRRASTCTSLHSIDTPSLVEESVPSSSPSTKDRGKQLKSNQRSVEASILLLLPVGLLVTSAIEHALTHCNSKIEKTVIKEQTPQQSDETRHRKEMFRASKANHLPLSVLKKHRQVLQLVETSGEEGFEWIPICIKQAAKKASKVKKKGSKELISRERLQRRAFTRRRRHTPTDINMKKLLTAHLYREKRGNASKVKSKKEKKGGGRSGSRRVLGTIQEETLVECRDGGFLDSLENPSISCIKTSSLQKG